MKFCPYCGVSLPGGAAFYCSECGAALRQGAKRDPVPDTDSNRPMQEAIPANPTHETTMAQADKEKESNPSSMRTDYTSSSGYRKLAKAVMRPDMDKKSRNKRARRKKNRPESSTGPKPDIDEGYDGYYNDVTPLDDGHIHDRMDPELIKRAVYIAAVAIAIIILSFILMYLL